MPPRIKLRFPVSFEVFVTKQLSFGQWDVNRVLVQGLDHTVRGPKYFLVPFPLPDGWKAEMLGSHVGPRTWGKTLRVVDPNSAEPSQHAGEDFYVREK